ncbi:MAG TPA: hypothetical protein VH105_00635 [Burkholderiales bacterium]|jgi:hypothetical protein|nr:hypothetical protein [Burkholderiales bacterium]
MNRPNPKHLLATALVGLGLCAAAGSAQAAVAVSIGEPGFYGSIDIGGAPPPALIYNQPVISGPAVYGAPPVYLRVPIGYERHWDRYCYRYQACGRPVYFVQDRWYREAYIPHYHRMHGGPGFRHEERREFRHEERRDERHHDHH